MKHRKFFLCYADGGGKMGLGHLSRLTTLSQKLNIQDKVVFLYDNMKLNGIKPNKETFENLVVC